MTRGEPRDLGDLQVRRVLPARACRTVGPFVFLDEMGPATFSEGQGIDVRPHPHIGLATLTYLYEGEILHRDSVGSEQCIRPGEVNWMSAGHGVVHSERTPPQARAAKRPLHGLQLWVALPIAHEESEPHFFHHGESELPLIQRPGLHARVVAGTFEGRSSPLRTFAAVTFVDLQLEPGAALTLAPTSQELGLYIVSGEIAVSGQSVGAGTLAVLDSSIPATVAAAAPARVALLGGDPLEAPRHLWWNFVSSRLDRIERAKEDWRERRFPAIENDDVEFIPLPDR